MATKTAQFAKGKTVVFGPEGFARVDEWRRAFLEINDFEEQLAESGIVVSKFWIHIGKDEQLRRFKQREEIAFKRYKITAEDWRNREKWDAYHQAVCDMVDRTSTGIAPWTLVEANDKNYARVKVIRTICEPIFDRPLREVSFGTVLLRLTLVLRRSAEQCLASSYTVKCTGTAYSR